MNFNAIEHALPELRQNDSRTTHCFLTSAINSAVHSMHLCAIESFMQQTNYKPIRIADGLRAITSFSFQPRHHRSTIFFQSTGLSNLLTMPISALLRYRRVYYLHEPTALSTKLSNGDPLLKALAMQIVQLSDCFWSNTILVSNETLRARTPALFCCAASKIKIAPLLLPTPTKSTKKRNRITYLGRIDSRRYFDEFLESASVFKKNGFVPTILTGDVAKLQRYAGNLSSLEFIDIYAKKNFSEDLKTKLLLESSLIWNPKRCDIAQSGVTADALRFGTLIVLSKFDPDFEILQEKGIAVDYDAMDINSLRPLGPTEAAEGTTTANSLYEQRHGYVAFTKSYLPIL